MIVRLSNDEARVDGRADVDDLAELFDTELGLEDEDEYDTVGGLIYHRIGGVPEAGRPGRGRRADADGRDDRRPARRQGARASASRATGPTTRTTDTACRRSAIRSGSPRSPTGRGPASGRSRWSGSTRSPSGSPSRRAPGSSSSARGRPRCWSRLLRRWPGDERRGVRPQPLVHRRGARRGRGCRRRRRRLSLIETDSPGALLAGRSVDLAIAMGATGIVGEQAGDHRVSSPRSSARAGRSCSATARGCRSRRRPASRRSGWRGTSWPRAPRDWLLWARPPDWRSRAVELVTPEEWDAYEADVRGCRRGAGPPRTPATRSARRSWPARPGCARGYAAWRRASMGFAIGVFRVPGG